MSGPVSVAMATFNGARFLREQLATLLADLRLDDELVVVDDASGDATRDIVVSFGDARIRLIASERNQGVRASFERALQAATHPVVFLCDQDDRWLPGKRDALAARFDADPDCLLALSDAEVIDEQGRRTAPSFMALKGGFAGGLVATLVRNRYLGCTMALSRRLIDVALPIPARVPMHDMWFGILATSLGHVAYVERPFIQYRRHGGNVTPSTRRSWAQMIVWRWDLLRLTLGRLAAVRRGGGARGRRATPRDGLHQDDAC